MALLICLVCPVTDYWLWIVCCKKDTREGWGSFYRQALAICSISSCPVPVYPCTFNCFVVHVQPLFTMMSDYQLNETVAVCLCLSCRNPARIRHALFSMLQTPQNNIRILKVRHSSLHPNCPERECSKIHKCLGGVKWFCHHATCVSCLHHAHNPPHWYCAIFGKLRW